MDKYSLPPMPEYPQVMGGSLPPHPGAGPRPQQRPRPKLEMHDPFANAPQGPGFSVPPAEALQNPQEQAKLLQALGLPPSPGMLQRNAPPASDIVPPGLMGGPQMKPPPPIIEPRMDGGVPIDPSEMGRRIKSGGMADIPTQMLLKYFVESGYDPEIFNELNTRLATAQ